MTGSVKVSANDAGQVVVVSENNSDYGHIRVEQTRVIFDDKGWARKKTLSALIPGLVADLQALGLSSASSLNGKIIVKESLVPFNTSDPDRDYKMAGDTGINCCLDGEPIYRKTFFTEDMSAGDELIAHNNTDAIREAYAASEASGEATLGDA